jgi:hypothetical protein
VALIQLDCLPLKSVEFRSLLASYMNATYRFSLRNCPRAERPHARRTIALLAADHIITNWAFPEDWKAFRSYVSQVIRWSARNYLGSCVRSPEADWPLAECENVGEQRRTDLSWTPSQKDHMTDDEGRLALSSYLSLPHRAPAVPPQGEMSVHDAAGSLGVTARYLYQLITQRRLQTISGKNQIRLPKEEIDRARGVLARGDQVRAARSQLEHEGADPESARKRIYRALGRLPRI